MLLELVKVVDYLHRHNVVHCDIKPDNIMISANNRNLILIDFDKAYSDSLNDSSGDPSLYGLRAENAGSVRIDFQAIGKVTKKLKSEVSPFKFVRYKRFLDACLSPSANAQSLLEILNYKPRRGNQIMGIALILLAAVIAIILIIFLLNQSKNSEASLPGHQASVKDSIITSPSSSAKPPIAEETQPLPLPTSESKENPDIQPIREKSSTETPVSQETTLEDALRKADQLDKRMRPAYQGLSESLDRLAKLPADTSLSSQFLLAEIRALGAKEDELYAETFAIVQDMYPGISSREVWRILSMSEVYSSYKRRSEAIKRNYAKEYENRKQNGK